MGQTQIKDISNQVTKSDNISYKEYNTQGKDQTL